MTTVCKILGVLFDYNITKLQRVQNAAASFVLGLYQMRLYFVKRTSEEIAQASDQATNQV